MICRRKPFKEASSTLPTSRRRIVFLNRSYWPDIEATGQLLADLCAGLSERFEVHVVCGQPNSPEKGSTFLTTGCQKRDGVMIHRLDHRKFHKRNPFGRILNLLSFYFAADKYLKNSDLNPDIVVSETDPFLLPMAGARFAKRTEAAHCVYLQDIYPDVAVAVGKSRVPLVATFLRRKLRTAYSSASRIVVLGRCMRRRLMGPGWELPREKIEIIPNWADCETIRPVRHQDNSFRKRLKLDDSFVVMHSGNMGLTQRLDVLIDAAAHADWPKQAKLLIVGNGASRDKLLAHRASLKLPAGRVQFVDYQPRSALAESLSAADLHVVSMHENITGCLCPSKLYGIMAAGRSVIAIADPGTDLCQTIVERNLGWCVPPGDAAKIASSVARAVKERMDESAIAGAEPPGSRLMRARSAALDHFDRPVIVGRFARLLSDILSERGIKDHRFDECDIHSHAENRQNSESDSGIALTL